MQQNPANNSYRAKHVWRLEVETQTGSAGHALSYIFSTAKCLQNTMYSLSSAPRCAQGMEGFQELNMKKTQEEVGHFSYPGFKNTPKRMENACLFSWVTNLFSRHKGCFLIHLNGLVKGYYGSCSDVLWPGYCHVCLLTADRLVFLHMITVKMCVKP